MKTTTMFFGGTTVKRLLLAVCLVMATLGCEPQPKREPVNIELKIGQMVDLKIGGRGQIISVSGGRNGNRYCVRVNTNEGPENVWLDEFELNVE